MSNVGQLTGYPSSDLSDLKHRFQTFDCDSHYSREISLENDLLRQKSWTPMELTYLQFKQVT
jgi:hypothetical protein